MLFTKAGSEIKLVGTFHVGIHNARPEILVRCCLASGNTGEIDLPVSDIVATGGYDELRQSIAALQK